MIYLIFYNSLGQLLVRFPLNFLKDDEFSDHLTFSSSEVLPSWAEFQHQAVRNI